MKSNIRQVQKYIDSIPRQIKYASSNALNKTTDTALQAVENELAQSFKVSSSWYKVGNKFGARAKKSTKDNLVSIMGISRGGSVSSFNSNISTLGGSKEHWIYDHEGGATREGQNGGDILVPTNVLLGIVGSTKGRAGRKKVNSLLGKKNTVFEKEIKGRKYLLARSNKKVSGSKFAKTASGKTSKKRTKVQARAQVLFLITKKVKIKDSFDFFTPIINVFNRDLQSNFDKAFAEAIRTMK